MPSDAAERRQIRGHVFEASTCAARSPAAAHLPAPRDVKLTVCGFILKMCKFCTVDLNGRSSFRTEVLLSIPALKLRVCLPLIIITCIWKDQAK